MKTFSKQLIHPALGSKSDLWAICRHLRALASQTQQWTPRRPLYTHSICSNPKSSENSANLLSVHKVTISGMRSILAITQLFWLVVLVKKDYQCVSVFIHIYIHAILSTPIQVYGSTNNFTASQEIHSWQTEHSAGRSLNLSSWNLDPKLLDG